MPETWIRSLGWEDPLEKGIATYCSILAWNIPWTEEPGRLQSMGSQRVGQHLHFHSHLRQLLVNFLKHRDMKLYLCVLLGGALLPSNTMAAHKQNLVIFQLNLPFIRTRTSPKLPMAVTRSSSLLVICLVVAVPMSILEESFEFYPESILK